MERYLASAQTPRFQCATQRAYEVVRCRLESDWQRVSALVCLGDELALGALAACREAGKSVPERMSLVNSGDSALMAFAHPPVTVIDVDLERHIELAMQMLEAAVQGALPREDRRRLVEPRLIKRGSVAAPAI
jgi:DNA-binding LacI/PurR family transcriptional regulator